MRKKKKKKLIEFIFDSTWGTAEAKWFYDCENDSTGDKLSPINQNRTDDERLEMDLFTGLDPNIVPVDLDTVFLEFFLTNADFNSKKSFITSHGRFRAVILFFNIFNSKTRTCSIDFNAMEIL